MLIAIVNKSTLKIEATYESDIIDSSSNRRSWLHAEPICRHIEVPSELDADFLKAELVDGTITILEDMERKLEDIVKKELEAEELSISNAVRVCDAGRRIVAYAGKLNNELSITEEDAIAFYNMFSQLKGLLESGSLPTVKTLITQIPVGTMGITEDYKNKVLKKLNQYITEFGL